MKRDPSPVGTAASPLTPPSSDWSAGNQQWLTACFEAWCTRLAQGLPAPAAGLPAPPAGVLPAALRVGLLFGLSSFETELLILAAGVELHAGLRTAVAEAQASAGGGAAGRPLAAARDDPLPFSLALALLNKPHWDALSPTSALRRWGLAGFDLRAGAAQARLRIDERVLHQIAGVPSFDEALLGLARFDEAPDPQTIDAAADAALVRATTVLDPADGRPGSTLLLIAAAAQRDHACGLAAGAWARLGWRSLRVDTEALPGDARDLALLARRIEREAALAGAGITLLLDAEAGLCPKAQRLLSELGATLILVGTPSNAQRPLLAARRCLALPAPAAPTRPPEGLSAPLMAALQTAMQQFKVDAEALALVVDEARDAPTDEAAAARLWHGLRVASRGGLEGLAERLDSATRFDDLVLPDPVMAQLREIGSQLRLRERVYGEWGFGARGTRGQGIAALFTGDSGTGKTLAAEAIANEAGLDLYRVDLASTVSKYIGETEKNLARLFDAAEASGAVLLFDEADALFGKRSEVKDSHDRYANIEVAYLLQRIETYRGLAILTTNLKSALDRAFLRRLRFVVTFPFPDAALRARIWQRALPPAAPVQGLDFAQLGRIKVAGGSIRNIALGAAFLAAARPGPIDGQCIAAAARAEFAKLERSGADASLEGLA